MEGTPDGGKPSKPISRQAARGGRVGGTFTFPQPEGGRSAQAGRASSGAGRSRSAGLRPRMGPAGGAQSCPHSRRKTPWPRKLPAPASTASPRSSAPARPRGRRRQARRRDGVQDAARPARGGGQQARHDGVRTARSRPIGRGCVAVVQIRRAERQPAGPSHGTAERAGPGENLGERGHDIGRPDRAWGRSGRPAASGRPTVSACPRSRRSGCAASDRARGAPG